MKPILLVNFKVYDRVFGDKSLKLAKICDAIQKKKKNVRIWVAPPIVDTSLICGKVGIGVFSQHLSSYGPGKHTGFVVAKQLKVIGCKGSLINHSEHRLELKEIKEVVLDCKENKLISCVCAEDVKKVRQVAKFNPDYIAYEPPELIGGDISVTNSKPDIVEKAVLAARKINPKIKVLCGAGVKNKGDFRMAIKLGCYGVLVASGIVKAKDQRKAILEMIS